jgi:predicted HTH domain antitoxin
MKINRISLTMPQDLLEKSEKIAKEKAEDRSTTMRELLRLGIKQHLIEKGVTFYVEGKGSVEKAAEIADVSLWKFMDILRDRKIPLHYDLRDIKKEIKEICK